MASLIVIGMVALVFGLGIVSDFFAWCGDEPTILGRIARRPAEGWPVLVLGLAGVVALLVRLW